MVDMIETYVLYEDSFDNEARVHLFRRMLQLDEVECPRTSEELRDKLGRSLPEDVIWNFTYNSIHISMLFGDSTPGVPDFPRIVFSIETQEFDHPYVSPEKRQEHTEELVQFVRAWYKLSVAAGYPPVYVFGAAPTHVDDLAHDKDSQRLTSEGLHTNTLEELYWLQVLPPAMVENVGRERLASASAARVESLDNGAVLLLAHDDPLRWTGYQDVLAHFSLRRE